MTTAAFVKRVMVIMVEINTLGEGGTGCVVRYIYFMDRRHGLLLLSSNHGRYDRRLVSLQI